MITLKAALIAASAVGTVAVGGGATWAMTGTHHEAGLQSNGAKVPAAARQDPAPAPKMLPTCLPAKGDLPANLKGKVPADLPACAPSPDLKKSAPAAAPSARVPAKPGRPAVPELDCSKLRPAVKVGGAVEKAVMLPKGLRYASTVPGSADLRKREVCAVVQKWTGKAGRWLTVETLKTPSGMTQNQLRQALRLPEGGTPVTVAGAAGWQAPNGGGVLLFDPNGYSLLVNGSPVLAGGLQDVATALRQAR
jgi:hypothetical protein